MNQWTPKVENRRRLVERRGFDLDDSPAIGPEGDEEHRFLSPGNRIKPVKTRKLENLETHVRFPGNLSNISSNVLSGDPDIRTVSVSRLSNVLKLDH
jgi:hypothetical protein